MKFNKEQKNEISKIFFNLAQVDLITLFIANIVLGEKFSWITAIIGVILFIVFMIIGTYFKGGE